MSNTSTEKQNPPLMSVADAKSILYPKGYPKPGEVIPGFLSCPDRPPSRDLTDQSKNNEAMGKALGATTCKADASNTQSSLNMLLIVPFAGTAVNTDSVQNTSSSFGCENIALISQIQSSVTSNISCILQNTVVDKDIELISNLSISFSNTSLTIDGNFDISQKSDMKVVSSINLSSNQTSSIVQQLAAAAAITNAVVQSATSQNAGVVPPNKTVQNLMACSDVNNFTKQVNNTMANLSIKTNADQTISFSGVNIVLHGNFILTQNTIFDIASSAIVTAAMSNVINTSAQIVSVLSAVTAQKTEATNPSTVGFSGMINAIAGIVIAVVLIGAIVAVLKIFFSGNSSTPAARPQLRPPGGIPTKIPTGTPGGIPTGTQAGISTKMHNVIPTKMPSVIPTKMSSVIPTKMSSVIPTKMSSIIIPTKMSSVIPTKMSSVIPTKMPSVIPTKMPSVIPTKMSSIIPTKMSSIIPTKMSSIIPTKMSSVIPTKIPSGISNKMQSVKNLSSKLSKGFKTFQNIARSFRK